MAFIRIRTLEEEEEKEVGDGSVDTQPDGRGKFFFGFFLCQDERR